MGITEMDKTHLLIAQTAITATRVLVKAAQNIPLREFVDSVRDLYKTECRPVLQETLSDKTQHRKTFIQTFTKGLAERIQETFEECVGPVSDAHPGSVPLVCYTESVLQTYLEQICQNDSSYPTIECKADKIPMKNGMEIKRTTNGAMTFTSKRSLILGRISFSPSSVYRAPIMFHAGGLFLSKYQSDVDFLTALEETLKGIASSYANKTAIIRAPTQQMQRAGIHADF